jgi:hypothetical protein
MLEGNSFMRQIFETFPEKTRWHPKVILRIVLSKTFAFFSNNNGNIRTLI